MTGKIDDHWAAADAYEWYMGRWSRLVATEFIAWLQATPQGHWLEVGSGTGALTAAIIARGAPASIVACDPSASFVGQLAAKLGDTRVSHVVAGVDALPVHPNGFDVVVSGLVLNFIPEPQTALSAMRDRCRPGGMVAAYVWDYDGGVDFLRHFWEEAVALDRSAAALDESRRFGAWHLSHLASVFEAAGFDDVQQEALAVLTPFETFDDFWKPFLGGTGPAPSYVASLTESQRTSLARRLDARLPRAGNGHIQLHARALAARGLRR